jgi:hypothetical protein
MDDKRTIAWFSAFVVVVLLAGIATGILLDRFLLRSPAGRLGWSGGQVPPNAGWMGPGSRPGPDGARGGGRGMPPEALADRLERELKLTAVQKEKVIAILARRRTKLEGIRGEMQDRMQKEQADLRAEIRSVLDAQQQKQFDQVATTAPGLGARPAGPGMRRGR